MQNTKNHAPAPELKLTANESAALAAYPSFQFVSDYSPEEVLAGVYGTESTWSWAFTEDVATHAGISLRAARGVVSSMVKKGLVVAHNEGPKDEHTIELTALGLAQVAALHHPAPAPELTCCGSPAQIAMTGHNAGCPNADETPAQTPEAPVSSTFAVVWPKAVGRIFWRALAKDSAEILATARGLSRHSNETKGELTITGPHDEALALAAALPHLFTDANTFLKEWRKTSPNYKCHDLKTTEGRRDAWAVEQQFLRDFFRAVAGVAPAKEKSDGVVVGRAYAAGKAEVAA